MFDIKAIRDDPSGFDQKLKRRGLGAESSNLIALDDKRRLHISRLQELQERRNVASKKIGEMKSSGEDATSLIEEVSQLKAELQSGEDEEQRLTSELNDAMSVLPNLPLDDVPVGSDESSNVLLREHGDKPSFDFQPKEHFEIGESLAQMDFEVAARLSGSRFVLLSGQLARLERALGQFMLDLHTTEHGYSEVSPPLLVRDGAMFGTGQLPKFGSDLFRTEDGFWLIPTAEVPLTNIVRESIVEHDYLPRRYTALTACFRSEAGAAGRDTRGMLRQHQFSKVELVSITDSESGESELERMLGCAEEVLKRLELHYRVMTLSTGDMGAGARKTYDIEVWLPGQDVYREISSCSYCGDFQARRMNARYRASGEKGTSFCHTLNGSGLAVGRTLIAILENYQEADGSVVVPKILRPYMGGVQKIQKNELGS